MEEYTIKLDPTEAWCSWYDPWGNELELAQDSDDWRWVQLAHDMGWRTDYAPEEQVR